MDQFFAFLYGSGRHRATCISYWQAGRNGGKSIEERGIDNEDFGLSLNFTRKSKV